jgi:Zn-dependent alcohol dehydrogenase
MTMKAPVLVKPLAPMVVEDVDLDDPQPGEVLVKMVASGVCHSCLYTYESPTATVPVILGDEGAGIVEGVGRGVDRVGPGDHVIISWAPACGRCHYCTIGRPVLCETRNFGGRRNDGSVRMHLRGQDVLHFGGVATYSSYAVIPDSCAIKIRDDMPLETAALIGCSVMTGVGSVLNTAKVDAGESLAVFGCGGVGLNAVQGGRLANAYPLIAVDVADNKLEFARMMGATHLINATRENAVERITQITGRGADYAVVAVGSTKVEEQAWASVARGGTCVVVGVPQGEILQIDPRATLVMAERCLKGSCYGSARPAEDFPRLVNLYLNGQLKIDELITKRYSIDQANDAFRDLAAGELARGLIVF